METEYTPVPFESGPVLVGLMPGQGRDVVVRAAELAATLGVPLLGAFVDPSSYLLEWTPGGHVDPLSLAPTLDPDDEAVQDAKDLEDLLSRVALEHGVEASFRVVAGDRAMAIGRLAEAVGAAVIVVGTRRPGLAARAEEMVGGSVVHKLTTTQHTPVLAIPGVVHKPHHG
ncbi:universal stress protein [Arthrobacter sp. 35W]|uniref:universal stress protein n=1 Tax=Arthrobacter sp. 35W TaxID=1132441 RepID=UPI0004024F3F|nr:universal stress protein [Arthrobacter sp. 35W]